MKCHELKGEVEP